MKKYKLALFIGRFQPFHNGHLFSLNKSLELADHVIVGVGSSQESGTEANPWDFESRKKMIESVVLGLPTQVVAIPDMFNDKKWGELILSIVRDRKLNVTEVVGVGNNDWTNRILKAIGIEVYETGLYNRDELEGIKIRQLMKEKDNSWEKRVPPTVTKYLEQYDLSN